jgi:DNA (cytosine-5)-methyltransferase 1
VGGGGLQPKIIDALNTMPDGTCRTIKSQYGNTSSANFEYSSTFGATGVIETVKINQATSQGYIECEVGGVADLSFPESKTRRGRVQEKGQVSPTLMAGEQDICRIENVYDFYNNNLKSDGICGTITSCCSHNGSGTFGVIENADFCIGGLQEHQTPRTDGISPSLTAAMGMGGGQTPIINCQYRIRKLTPRECWRLMDFTDEDFEKAVQVNSNTQLYKQAGNSIVKNVLVAILGQMIPGKEDVYKN